MVLERDKTMGEVMDRRQGEDASGAEQLACGCRMICGKHPIAVVACHKPAGECERWKYERDHAGCLPSRCFVKEE